MLDETAAQRHSSASQHDTFNLCNRKWGLGYLDGIKAPPNQFAQRGHAIHRIGEIWLTQGIAPDATTDHGKMFVAGIKHLPPPKSGIVEHQFRLETSTGIYKGLWDYWDNGIQPERNLDTLVSKIFDHKTTTDFKWLKDPDALRKDPQSVLYAVAAMTALRKLLGAPEFFPHIELNWVYYRAQASKTGSRRVVLHVLPDGKVEPARPSTVRPEHYSSMRYSELGDRFVEIEANTEVMLDHHRAGRKGMDLPFDLKGCRAYGGCPYLGTACKHTLGQLIQADTNQEEKRMDLAAKMKAAAAKEAAEAAANGAATTTPPAAPNPSGADLAARMASASSRASTAASAQATAETSAAVAQTQPAAVNPPESAQVLDAMRRNNTWALSDADAVSSKVSGRLRMAGNIASGIAASRIFNHSEPRYAEQVGHLAVEVTDAIIKAAGK